MPNSACPVPERNWPAFYDGLCEIAPLHLHPRDDLAPAFDAEMQCPTEAFYSDDLLSIVDEPSSDVEEDVRFVLTLWLENVRRYFEEFPYCFDRDELADLQIVETDSLVKQLVARLQQPHSEAD